MRYRLLWRALVVVTLLLLVACVQQQPSTAGVWDAADWDQVTWQ